VFKDATIYAIIKKPLFFMTIPGQTIDYKKVLLWVFPFLYLALGFYFRELLGNLSLRSMDPDYVYYMSGLLISDGSLKLHHIDHPGTPLQVIMAVFFRVIHIIRGSGNNFIEDVFLHPDLYLSVTNQIIIVLTSLLLFFAGSQVLKYTKSVFYALIVQTAPFLPVIWYDLIGRITPELMLPFPVILLTILTIKLYSEGGSTSKQSVLLLAVISALGLSIKLTYLPFLIIPLFIIDTWKKRLIFAGITLGCFFVFAFPVTLQIGRFWGWITALFMGSGQYGGGESNIIDLASMKSNLSELIHYEKRFFYVFLALIATLVGYLAWFRKKAEKRITLLGVAVVLSIAIQVLMVGKHYAHRYFIPVLLLSPLLVYIIAELIKKFYTGKVMNIAISVAVAVMILLSVEHNLRWLPIKTKAMGSDIENRLPSWHFAQLLEKDSYKILTSQDYGAPFIEYTLTYSHVWSNSQKRQEYASILDKLYPNVYNYFTWDNTLKYWVEPFDAGIIMASGKNVYLYIERDEEELYDKTLAKLHEESPTAFIAERELLYRNPATTEVIYQLRINSPGDSP
jgi:hypothetical protein